MGAVVSELSTCLILAAVLGLWIGWIVRENRYAKRQKSRPSERNTAESTRPDRVPHTSTAHR